MSPRVAHTDVNFHPFPKMSRLDKKVPRTRVFRSSPGLTDCLLRSEVWNHLKSMCLLGTSFPRLRCRQCYFHRIGFELWKQLNCALYFLHYGTQILLMGRILFVSFYDLNRPDFFFFFLSFWGIMGPL